MTKNSLVKLSKITNLSFLRKNHFSSGFKLLKEDFEFKPLFVKEQQYQKYLNNLPKPPLNLYWNTSKNLEKYGFFSNQNIRKWIHYKEINQIKSIYIDFLKGLEGFDEKELQKILEGKYYKFVIDFLDKFENSHLAFKIFKPNPLLCNMEFMVSEKLKGIFIERFLNFDKTNYFIKEAWGTKVHKLSGKPPKIINLKKRNKEELIHDNEILETLDFDDFEDMRKYYNIGQIIVKIQTNMRLNIYEKTNENTLVFGSEDPELLETRYLQLEYKTDPIFIFPKKFILTDVDNILEGNPHFI